VIGAPVWIGVALLGGGGAIARFALDRAIGAHAAQASSLPLGTLAVNASGALLLGLLSGAGVGGDALVLAGAATLGSYTTFSTWMLESQRLAEEAQGRSAALNILLSLAAGVAAVALGHTIGAAL
jgi:CrcB protein